MAHVMVKECCEAVADMVDFADYDWDGDGEVEEVFVLYAGYGEATGGGSRTIWPHMWTITEATKPGDDAPEAFTVDGLRVDVYACSNELYGSRGTTEMGIGCFCHEFSHCLGLPDLYDTENSYTYVMGAWDLLDSGCYNGPDGLGWVPAGFNSYEKQFVGWYDIKELKTDTIVDRMLPLNEGGEAYEGYGPGAAGAEFLLPALRDGDSKRYRLDVDFVIHKREMTNFGEKQSAETYNQKIVYYMVAERNEDDCAVRISKESGKDAE